MRKIKLLVFSFVLVALLAAFAVPPTPVHAWWWSDYATVSVPIKTTGILLIDAFDCKSAKMSGIGGTYNATVSNPWLSNNCNLNFNNVNVKKSGWYTVTYTYKYLFSTKTVNASVYVTKPLWSGTYTTSTVSLRP